MTQTLIRYALDTTGINRDNLVQNENHTLADKRVRAIAPLQGAFYTAGVRVRDKHDDRVLVHGIDYVFAELYQSLTIKYGKEIVGVILVINTTVGSDVAIDYQCIGGDFSRSTESLVDLLKTRSDEDFSTSFWDIRNRPPAFVPSPHLHDLGDIYGFEHLVFALEKVRNAIVWADMVAIDSIMTYVDDFVANLTRLINHRVDTELLDAIIQFKRSFTKNYVGLSNILNFGTASEEEGRQIANPDFVLVSGKEDKYVTIKTLMGFKAVLYNQMVSSGLTNLGKSYGVLALPLKTTILSLPNGAQILLDSLQNIKNSNSPIDNEVYPDLTKQKDRWAIVKVSNNQQDRGGVLMGLNMNTGETYSGLLSVLPNGSSITWKRYLTDNNTQGFLNALIEHMEDPGDPHKTKKHHVGLGFVENLAIATREDIVCRKPLRKYITYDGLLLFMKAFMTGVSTIEDIEEDDTSPSAVARYQMIFAPCGPCVPGGEYSNVPIPPPTPTSVPVSKLNVLVTDSGENEFSPVSEAYVSFNGVVGITETDGTLEFTNLIVGETYTITASHIDFYDYSLEYTVLPGINTLNIKLVKIIEEKFEALLTWGYQPRDLDTHFSFPLENGGRSKVWHNVMNVENRVNLSIEDAISYGPETTTFFIRNPTTGAVIPGIYRFSVHHFSGSGNISNSEVVVRLYMRDGSIQTFTPPSNIINGVNDVWVVFEMNVSPDGTFTVLAIDSYYTAKPSEVT